MQTYTAEAENVEKGVKADSGKGTAKALAQAAEESGVEMFLIEQGTDQLGNDRVRVWTGYEAGEDSEFTIESKPVPQELHAQITDWGYEIESHHDNTEANEQHVYMR